MNVDKREPIEAHVLPSFNYLYTN